MKSPIKDDSNYKQFEKLVIDSENSEQPVPQHQLAEDYFSRKDIEKCKTPDLDSFLRQFRRWRKKAQDK